MLGSRACVCVCVCVWQVLLRSFFAQPIATLPAVWGRSDDWFGIESADMLGSEMIVARMSMWPD